MRCQACNKRLNEFEVARKDTKTKEYIDLCGTCYNTVLSEMYYSDKEVLNIYEDEPLTNLINYDTL